MEGEPESQKRVKKHDLTPSPPPKSDRGRGGKKAENRRWFGGIERGSCRSEETPLQSRGLGGNPRGSLRLSSFRFLSQGSRPTGYPRPLARGRGSALAPPGPGFGSHTVRGTPNPPPPQEGPRAPPRFGAARLKDTLDVVNIARGAPGSRGQAGTLEKGPDKDEIRDQMKIRRIKVRERLRIRSISPRM